MGEARFSPDGRHRYFLGRFDLHPGAPRGSCLFIMLNPSTADAERNDPTVTRCIGYAKRWGFRHLEVCNLFSIRGTDPAVIHTTGATGDPVNMETILWRAQGASLVVCAWGVHGAFWDRGRHVLAALLRAGVAPECLGLTKGGHPRHPLYLPGSVTPFT